MKQNDLENAWLDVDKLAQQVKQDPNVSPVVRRRLASMLDALSAECLALAHSEGATQQEYRQVLQDIETLAEVLRESELAGANKTETEWTLADRAHDAQVARTIERGSQARLCAVDADSESSGWSRTLTMQDARRVIDALREEDMVRHDVQRALA